MQDRERLKRNGLDRSALSVAPPWLAKWASLICEYLEFEEAKFPLYFMEDYPPGMKVEEIMVDAKAQKETQIQNIAITIDKIMHVLE